MCARTTKSRRVAVTTRYDFTEAAPFHFGVDATKVELRAQDKLFPTCGTKLLAARARNAQYDSGGSRGGSARESAEVSVFAAPRHPLAKTRNGKAAHEPARLGRASIVKGTLDMDGELFVHGYVVGRINAEKLVIAEGGSVEGDIVAREVRVGGKLNGRIFALEVTLDASANVTGRVFHHTVTVARGARIDGRMPWRPPSYFETLEQLPEMQP